MDECIFCKIVNGKLPCNKIYEDENFIAFFDVNPVVEGHTLVISKKHFENIFETSDEISGKINLVCKKVAILLKEKFNVNAVNIINASGRAAQQSVFHLHYHVIPRRENDGLDLWFHKKGEDK